jgi:hypothetical protein
VLRHVITYDAHVTKISYTKNIEKTYFLFISTLNLSPYPQSLDDKDDELLLWNHGVLKL